MRRGSWDLVDEFFPAGFKERFSSLKRAVVSLSGGVDSSCVLALLAGLMPEGSLWAVNFRSFFHFPDEQERCVKMCSDFGVPLLLLPGPELTSDEVRQNVPRRCALCKSLRLERLQAEAQELGAVIVDGTNADDLKDKTRLGNEALARCTNLFSPLAEGGLTKARVRELSRRLEIPWADEPATACLATRFPRETALDPAECRRAGKAERALAAQGIRARLRAYRSTVCVELYPPIDWGHFRPDVILKTLRAAGYTRVTVDLEGYQTGRGWLD